MNALPTTVDAGVKWTAIASLVVAAAGAAAAIGLEIPAWEMLLLTAIAAPLAAGVMVMERSGYQRSARCLVAVVQFVLFTCFYTAVTCLVVMGRRPLVDSSLIEIDRWFHVDLGAVVAWSRGHPVLNALLTLAYQSVVPQTLLTIFLLGLLEPGRRLELFLLRLMTAAMLTLAIFAAFPAVGPFLAYHYDLTAAQQHYLDCFQAYRSADPPRAIHLFILEGLIAFPSFHAAWAVLLTAAYAHRPRLLAAFGLLNVAVVASTLTTGSHYWSDVAAGLVVGAISVAATGARSRESGVESRE